MTVSGLFWEKNIAYFTFNIAFQKWLTCVISLVTNDNFSRVNAIWRSSELRNNCYVVVWNIIISSSFLKRNMDITKLSFVLLIYSYMSKKFNHLLRGTNNKSCGNLKQSSNSTEQIPSSEADSRQARKEIPHLLWNSTFHHCAHKSLASDSILIQMNHDVSWVSTK